MSGCGVCGTDNGCKCGGTVSALRAQIEDDQKRGLYGKYKVERLDGSSAKGGKHERCMYYVLDLEHDKHAKAAIRAYAESCAKDYPELAKDLREMLKPQETCGCRSAEHSCGRFFDPPKRPRFGS